MVSKYILTEEDIKQLIKPSAWRDYLDSNDPRSWEEFHKDWLTRQPKDSIINT
jgi:hypothetical protein